MQKPFNPPSYYKGKYKGILAKDICSDFELTYNIGNAVCYLLRCGKKPGNPSEQDIRKAIDHLNFELEILELSRDERIENLKESIDKKLAKIRKKKKK